MGVSSSEWILNQAGRSLTDSLLIFVSMEHAASQSFRAWLLYINDHRCLDRVVIDEAHLILTTTDYRPKLAAVNWLTVLTCQIVYLTATLPPLKWKSFTDDLLINNPITIRSSTFRRNIGLQVNHQGRRRANQQTFIDYCVEKIRIRIDQVKRDKDARLLVICRFKKEAQALATCLECECYYSNISTTADKAAILARWLGGEYQIICGTKGLATGLDHPSIRIVFFIKPPDNALELMQKMGRARREGIKRSICQILLDADWKVPDINIDGQFMDTNQRTISYCLNGGKYRKQALSQYINGVLYTCESNIIGRSAEGAPYVPCNYCLNRPARQRSPPAAEALPADDQAATLDLQADDQAATLDLQAPTVAVPEVERLQVHVRDKTRAREEFLQGLRALHS